jgi:hypothetical protein
MESGHASRAMDAILRLLIGAVHGRLVAEVIVLRHQLNISRRHRRRGSG